MFLGFLMGFLGTVEELTDAEFKSRSTGGSVLAEFLLRSYGAGEPFHILPSILVCVAWQRLCPKVVACCQRKSG